MNADYLNEPYSNPSEPLIAVLYGERKIQVLKNSGLNIINDILISEWSEVESQAEGFVLFVPNSDFVVSAKAGETKISINSYINDPTYQDRYIETFSPSISSIIFGKDHKVLSIFDREVAGIMQYNIKEIKCSKKNSDVLGCTNIFYDQGI